MGLVNEVENAAKEVAKAPVDVVDAVKDAESTVARITHGLEDFGDLVRRYAVERNGTVVLEFPLPAKSRAEEIARAILSVVNRVAPANNG